MRVCPKCRYKELIWRHLQHARFTDYCHISELELEQPELAKKLQKTPKFYTDGLYNYRLVPAGFVHRIWRDDAESPNSIKEPDMEKPKNICPFVAIVRRPKLPSKQWLAPRLKQLFRGHEKELDETFGRHKWRHWIRTDNSGFSYPSKEDWQQLQTFLKSPKQIDEMLTFQTVERQKKLLEESEGAKHHGE